MPHTALTRAILQGFSPLEGLNPESAVKLAADTPISELAAGHYLFRQGDTGKHSLYLLDGEIELRAGERTLAHITAGTPGASRPLAPQIPRRLSARALTDIQYFSLDSDLLDIMLTWNQTGAFEVGELQAASGAETGQDWMTAVLQVNAFHRIPPANIQALLLRMQQQLVKQGEVIVRQGDAGDYFYVVTAGRCVVVREAAGNLQGIPLAELGPGASFGEEALLTDAPRNASVRMLTDGKLARLAKTDFNALLIAPQQQWLSLEQARQIVAAGGCWLDVRLSAEFAQSHPEGALNLPLYQLRFKLDKLDPKLKYVVCCDTGRRSSAAAYILSERGFDVCILKDGLLAMFDLP